MCEWRVRLTSKHFVPNVRQGLGGLVPWVGGGFPWDMSAPYSAVHTLMHALMTGRWQLHRKHFCFLFSTCETPNPSQLFTSLTYKRHLFLRYLWQQKSILKLFFCQPKPNQPNVWTDLWKKLSLEMIDKVGWKCNISKLMPGIWGTFFPPVMLGGKFGATWRCGIWYLGRMRRAGNQ